MLEVEEFIAMSQSVQKEMKEKECARLNEASTPPPNPVPAVAAAVDTSDASIAGVATSISPTPPQPQTAVPITALPEPTRANEINVVESHDVAEQENLEDGPAYDPSGGQGSLAKGTRNTYIIPDMDAMSPEEYQKALQENLYKQQMERRKVTGSGYGNRASWNYLNNLTGESGVLKKDELEQ
jgi:hypothetical protein